MPPVFGKNEFKCYAVYHYRFPAGKPIFVFESKNVFEYVFVGR